MFSFTMKTTVWFGPGCRVRLAEILERSAWSGVGVVVDHQVRNSDSVRMLIDSLEAKAERVVVGECRVSEPTYEALDALRPAFDDPALQVVVGIGGGSALDTAKAMAVLVHNREPALHYRGFDRMTRPVLPIVALPTTAGTGSEVTPNASFVDQRERRKLGINGEAIRPRFALLDPELTLTCPRMPTVSAGVDSLVHATEAYVAKKTNPLARLFALEGFRRVFNSLPAAVQAPTDLHLRTEVMYGAFLAGVALMNSGTGPAAAMSYPLGVDYRVPHGLAGGLFLPAVAAHNVKRGVQDYADLYGVMENADRALPRDRQAKEFAACLHKVWRRLGVPREATALGLGPDGVDKFVSDTLQLKAALDQNPVSFGEGEIRGILAELMAGTS